MGGGVRDRRELKGLTESLLHRETRKGKKEKAHRGYKHIVTAVNLCLSPQSYGHCSLYPLP